MFKQIRDGIKAARINNNVNTAAAALEQRRLPMAERHLLRAYALLLNTRMPRTMHIQMITAWSIIGRQVRDLGHHVLADQ